jgi:hypothetical protein
MYRSKVNDTVNHTDALPKNKTPIHRLTYRRASSSVSHEWGTCVKTHFENDAHFISIM